MVAAAGLPPKCAHSVNGFLHLSASSAANSFYKAMAVTVEAGDPGSILLDVDEGDGQAAVPPGAEAGERAICYREHLVGGADGRRCAATRSTAGASTAGRPSTGPAPTAAGRCPAARPRAPVETRRA
ncbi:hypothetical protein SEVIR_1G234601v4 [Setaria viridis]